MALTINAQEVLQSQISKDRCDPAKGSGVPSMRRRGSGSGLGRRRRFPLSGRSVRFALVIALTAGGLASAPVGAGSAQEAGGVVAWLGDVSVVEGDEGSLAVRVPVTLSLPAPSNMEVPVRVSGSDTLRIGFGASSADVDVVVPGPSWVVRVAAGSRASSFTVWVRGDRDIEEHEETLRVDVVDSPPVVAGRSGAVRIVDDDAGGEDPGQRRPLRVDVGSVGVVEGTGGRRQVQVPVSLSRPPNSESANTEVTVSLKVIGGPGTVRGRDFTAREPETLLTFSQRKRREWVTVTVLGDSRRESGQEVLVTVERVHALPLFTQVERGVTQGRVSIIDDDHEEWAEDDESSSGAWDHGSLWATGANTFGQLGTDSLQPATELTGSGEPDWTWAQVTAGRNHSCGTRLDHQAFCWGDNSSGQIGDGSFTRYLGPRTVRGDHRWRTVTAGDRHSCGIVSDSALWCWGRNLWGQLGTGAFSGARPAPVRVGSASDWVQVSAGGDHTCGRRADGSLWCWGRNADGQLGDGTVTSRPAPVRVGSADRSYVGLSAGGAHTLVVQARAGALWETESDYLYIWGARATGDPAFQGFQADPELASVREASGWAMVSVGSDHACGIRESDESPAAVYCWGSNEAGAAGSWVRTNLESSGWRAEPSVLTIPRPIYGEQRMWIDVAAGGRSTCAIDSAHALYCWGYWFAPDIRTGREPIRQVTDFTDWVDIDASSTHFCGIRSGGSLWCWGTNGSYQLGDPAEQSWYFVGPVRVGTELWSDVATGEKFTCALKAADKSTWCWGASEAFAYDAAAGGTRTPVAIPGMAVFDDIDAGADHVCGIRSGVMRCWGSNRRGQLGLGPDTSVQTTLLPTTVHGEVTNWRAVSLGGDRTCGVNAEDELYCWGEEGRARAGGGETWSLSPTPVAPDRAWRTVSVGLGATAAIAWSRGDATTAGFDRAGFGFAAFLGFGTPGNPYAYVYEGSRAEENGRGLWSHIGGHCGVTQAGEGLCWGTYDNNGARADIPYRVDQVGKWRVIESSGDSVRKCGIRRDGSLWCWSYRERPREVGGHDWTEVSVNSYLYCGIKATGQLLCGSFGERLPTYIPNGTYGWSSVSLSGGGNGCGVRDEGVIWCWGSNQGGELGRGFTSPAPPTNPSAVPTFEAGPILAGDRRFIRVRKQCGISIDQKVICWGPVTGSPTPSELPGLPEYERYDDVVPFVTFTAGYTGWCVLSTNGNLWCQVRVPGVGSWQRWHPSKTWRQVTSTAGSGLVGLVEAR